MVEFTPGNKTIWVGLDVESDLFRSQGVIPSSRPSCSGKTCPMIFYASMCFFVFCILAWIPLVRPYLINFFWKHSAFFLIWFFCFCDHPNVRDFFGDIFKVFTSFLKFWALLGPVRIHSDVFGCVRKRLDAFGRVWTLSENFENKIKK